MDIRKQAGAWTTILLFCLIVSGCGGMKGGYSGFLGDYSGLRPSERVDGAMVYRSPVKTVADYDSFVIEPIQVHFAPGADEAAIDPAKLLELCVMFQRQLISELKAGGYKVVEEPRSDSLILRMAITDLKKNIPALNIHWATKLSGAGLGGAAIEGEGVDGTTGERVFALVHARQGSRMALSTKAFKAWGSAEEAIDFWAKKIVERLKEINETGTW